MASYHVKLNEITYQQFSSSQFDNTGVIIQSNPTELRHYKSKHEPQFLWSLGPYVTHRLFNPDMPLSLEAGAELSFDYKLKQKLKISGAFRKSILTNLTKNQRRSNSVLPRVHSNWVLYDLAGQGGHINHLKLSYTTNFKNNFYGNFHAGYLEPFFAGFGGEILYKPSNSVFGVGLDLNHVWQRDYNMLFGLRDYAITMGNISFYFDPGSNFDLEINLGRYLAGDWGATTKISRQFGNGWEVGAYATLTDVPFETFGEGSFDKGIYASMPMDWLVGKPNKSRRKFVIRPITRDGGARLSGARTFIKELEPHMENNFIERKVDYGSS